MSSPRTLGGSCLCGAVHYRASGVRRYELPTAARFTSTFCSQCGGRLPSVSRDAKTGNIPAGSLDDVPDIMPQARIYWGSRAPWSCDDALPRYEESRPG